MRLVKSACPVPRLWLLLMPGLRASQCRTLTRNGHDGEWRRIQCLVSGRFLARPRGRHGDASVAERVMLPAFGIIDGLLRLGRCRCTDHFAAALQKHVSDALTVKAAQQGNRLPCPLDAQQEIEIAQREDGSGTIGRLARAVDDGDLDPLDGGRIAFGSSQFASNERRCPSSSSATPKGLSACGR